MCFYDSSILDGKTDENYETLEHNGDVPGIVEKSDFCNSNGDVIVAQVIKDIKFVGDLGSFDVGETMLLENPVSDSCDLVGGLVDASLNIDDDTQAVKIVEKPGLDCCDTSGLIGETLEIGDDMADKSVLVEKSVSDCSDIGGLIDGSLKIVDAQVAKIVENPVLDCFDNSGLIGESVEMSDDMADRSVLVKNPVSDCCESSGLIDGCLKVNDAQVAKSVENLVLDCFDSSGLIVESVEMGDAVADKSVLVENTVLDCCESSGLIDGCLKVNDAKVAKSVENPILDCFDNSGLIGESVEMGDDMADKSVLVKNPVSDCCHSSGLIVESLEMGDAIADSVLVKNLVSDCCDVGGIVSGCSEFADLQVAKTVVEIPETVHVENLASDCCDIGGINDTHVSNTVVVIPETIQVGKPISDCCDISEINDRQVAKRAVEILKTIKVENPGSGCCDIGGMMGGCLKIDDCKVAKTLEEHDQFAKTSNEFIQDSGTIVEDVQLSKTQDGVPQDGVSKLEDVQLGEALECNKEDRGKVEDVNFNGTSGSFGDSEDDHGILDKFSDSDLMRKSVNSGHGCGVDGYAEMRCLSNVKDSEFDGTLVRSRERWQNHCDCRGCCYKRNKFLRRCDCGLCPDDDCNVDELRMMGNPYFDRCCHPYLNGWCPDGDDCNGEALRMMGNPHFDRPCHPYNLNGRCPGGDGCHEEDLRMMGHPYYGPPRYPYFNDHRMPQCHMNNDCLRNGRDYRLSGIEHRWRMNDRNYRMYHGHRGRFRPLDSMEGDTENSHFDGRSSMNRRHDFMERDFRWDKAPFLGSSEPEQHPVGAGLRNLGNTCFLNAIMQCFTHTVPLVEGLQSLKHEPSSHGLEFCVLCAVRLQIERSLAFSGKIISPTDLVDNLKNISSDFRRHQQEDAHEFLMCLLDKLDSYWSKHEADAGEPSSSHDSLVNEVFGGRLVSELRCCKCGHTSDSYEPVTNLSLEIEDVDDLESAFKSFTKVENLEDIACDRCTEKQLGEKQLLLDQAPPIAALHLKRFKSDGINIEKIDRTVKYPLEFDLHPYTKGARENNEVLKYELYAFVVHVGLSSTLGHYFCYIRTSPDAWYRFDDSKVTKVSEFTAFDQEAYILFYARKGTPWFGDLLEKWKAHVQDMSDTSPKSVLDTTNLPSTSIQPESTLHATKDSCNTNLALVPYVDPLSYLKLYEVDKKSPIPALDSTEANASDSLTELMHDEVSTYKDDSKDDSEKTKWDTCSLPNDENPFDGNINPLISLEPGNPNIKADKEEPASEQVSPGIRLTHLETQEKASIKGKMSKAKRDLARREAAKYVKSSSMPINRRQMLMAVLNKKRKKQSLIHKLSPKKRVKRKS